MYCASVVARFIFWIIDYVIIYRLPLPKLYTFIILFLLKIITLIFVMWTYCWSCRHRIYMHRIELWYFSYSADVLIRWIRDFFVSRLARYMTRRLLLSWIVFTVDHLHLVRLTWVIDNATKLSRPQTLSGGRGDLQVSIKV